MTNARRSRTQGAINRQLDRGRAVPWHVFVQRERAARLAALGVKLVAPEALWANPIRHQDSGAAARRKAA